MYERDYQVEHIKQALWAPDSIRPQQDGSIRVRKSVRDGLHIVVIYAQTARSRPNEYVIISVYYT